ncbi:hypothetical protein [Macrococcus capreoli]|uniref:hypothetical protein n=1 Tax=Macrococcus capreoli TaxID=2982690 RepID=UPI0021D6102B|nr:hypothetical protein [Macrococcus sp. TMW 2.2395]MCU7557954.1 hypothetical protein [Macrococcus sp. TMW 2.2395]
MGILSFIGTVISAGASAIYDSTGGRKIMYEVLETESDKDVMEFFYGHKDDGDYDTYRAAKLILEMRGYSYDEKNDTWNKKDS